MPTLRKRKLKSGATYWDIRYSQGGKDCYQSIGVTDRRTAEKILTQFRMKFAESKANGTGLHLDATVTESRLYRLTNLAKDTADFAKSNKSEKTSDREQLVFRNLIAFFGDLEVGELTGALIEKYKANRLETASAHTVNIEVRVLNTAVNQAVELGLLAKDTVPRFRLIRTSAPEPPSWLNAEQINQVLSHGDIWFRRFMQFALNTGCRRNELLGLDWSDVDLARRQITIRGQIGKMGKRRTLPINDTLHELLVKWPQQHAGLLFPMYSPDTISQKFRRWVRQLGLPKGISLHSLRSTFACHLIDKGVDIYTVSQLLGHSSVKVTERHYLALEQDHVVSAVNKLRFSDD